MTNDCKIPARNIAPWTTVRLMPSEEHIQINCNDSYVQLDREAISLLIEWCQKAGFGVIETWPGVKPS